MVANRASGWSRLEGVLGRARRVASAWRRARRARAAFRPDVDALEGRQLLTSYKFLTRASISSLEGQVDGLVMDARGDVFGATSAGGTAGDGAIFELAKGARRPRTLASFSSATGERLNGPLLIDRRGDLFGMTRLGGANNDGTIFELARRSRKIAVLASFGLGQGGDTLSPTNLVRDSQGNLYGTAIARYGDRDGTGMIFELPAGSHTISTLYSFFSGQAPRGSQPDNGLAVDAHGDLFGTYFLNGAALQPGPSGSPQTFLFELPKGAQTITRLATINTGVNEPADGLALAPNGTLYGVTPGQAETGGPDAGSVFSYLPGSGASTVTTLASFHGTDGANPFGNPVVDARGAVFGTTSLGGPDFSPPQRLGYGTVYEVAAGSDTVNSLVGFNLLNGFSPYGLVEDRRGDLFGIVQHPTSATIFELAVVRTPRRRR